MFSTFDDDNVKDARGNEKKISASQNVQHIPSSSFIPSSSARFAIKCRNLFPQSSQATAN